jgi:hypothetical protein
MHFQFRCGIEVDIHPQLIALDGSDLKREIVFGPDDDRESQPSSQAPSSLRSMQMIANGKV